VIEPENLHWGEAPDHFEGWQSRSPINTYQLLTQPVAAFQEDNDRGKADGGMNLGGREPLTTCRTPEKLVRRVTSFGEIHRYTIMVYNGIFGISMVRILYRANFSAPPPSAIQIEVG